MKVGMIGIGAMGLAMAGHVAKAGFEVTTFDSSAEAQNSAKMAGLSVSKNLSELCVDTDIVIIMVATDSQTCSVVTNLLNIGLNDGAVIVVAATNHPLTMIKLAKSCEGTGVSFVDAPVCYGKQGAKNGDLISLCGGEVAAIERVTPVLMSYSRSVEYIGGHGCGQIGKTCNNMMHWAACVANFETLALAKACGIDAQQMRETLLKCPARNTTLERWDTTRFTWHEKDMDVALDLAQRVGVPLPLFGSVDQLVKQLGPEKVASLLYGESAEYMGTNIIPKKLVAE